jgi:hypothetical protein
LERKVPGSRSEQLCRIRSPDAPRIGRFLAESRSLTRFPEHERRIAKIRQVFLK